MLGQLQPGSSLKLLIQEKECFTLLHGLVNVGGKYDREEPYWLDHWWQEDHREDLKRALAW
jgi:hypothetical protein